MKHMKVAEARAQFGEMLDRAEQGLPVIIERRGVRFKLVAESSIPPGRTASKLFERIDGEVMNGQWSWTAAAGGLTFTARPRRK